MKTSQTCENCRYWKCMGYHYYECTRRDCATSRGDSCHKFTEE